LKFPRLVIGGVTSGVGKTSITCSIIYGLKKQGYSIQPYKVGPDYIDPSYLSAVSGNECRNLDVWLMGKKELVKSFIKNSKSDIASLNMKLTSDISDLELLARRRPGVAYLAAGGTKRTYLLQLSNRN